MDIDNDLNGIANLMRRHIEIRNRSWMKRIHRDCFVGSEAVDFLVMQGFADTRKAAVEIGVKMNTRKLIRNITESRKFSDSLHYYRFFDDDQPTAALNKMNAGHVPGGSCLGHGGCKWSFAPHTAHNSYILDIALAEELERAVAGASLEARALAISKLRSRVKEQCEVDAPNWDLNQTISVNGTQVNVFTRTRPRGDWKNVKMTGVVPESPVNFIRAIVNFDRRRQWESAFEDGVIVEAIDTGEKPNILITDTPEDLSTANTPATATNTINNANASESAASKGQFGSNIQTNTKVARATDDVYSFLATVDLAGIPQGMAIAFLNDPERQHALAHLRKQMLLSQPQECMLCGASFCAPSSSTSATSSSAADSHMDTMSGFDYMRFCPCCAMVSCAGCVSKRVFEVVSRSITSVCVHCFRESSRIFQPPQAVQDESHIDAALRGKWWRPEELGLMDYSTPASATSYTPSAAAGGIFGQPKKNARDSVALGTSPLYNDEDQLNLTPATLTQLKPLIPGLLDDLLLASSNGTTPATTSSATSNAQSGSSTPSAQTPVKKTLTSMLSATLSLSSSKAKSAKKSSTTANANANASAGVVVEGDEGAVSEGEEVVSDEEDEEESESEEEEEEGEVHEEVQQSRPFAATAPATTAAPSDNTAPPTPSAASAVASPPAAPAVNPKLARCKGCGEMISRDIEAIERHMESECSGVLYGNNAGGSGGANGNAGGANGAAGSSRLSVAHDPITGGRTMSVSNTNGSYVINAEGNIVYTPHSTARSFALFPRRPDLAARFATRIIYRTARTSLASLQGSSVVRSSIDQSAANNATNATNNANTTTTTTTTKVTMVNEQRQPREVCALQDSFVDAATGTCYAYEVSVRHSDVRGIGIGGGKDSNGSYITADVHALIYVARPLKASAGNAGGSQISIISQIDTRARSSKWAALELSGYLGNLGGSRVGGGMSDIAGVRKQDLIRELQQCKDLRNLLEDNTDDTDDANAASADGGKEGVKGVSLEDFELLAVLGRGGFGKVMQVRHTATNAIYAMKILKKSELRRRRQVERTQTERNILANVRHPFIVCLHYAFQNAQKLYMVMDFVQGGDFFTLMRKFRRLPEDWVKLYVMEVALALQHLHDREIVYRDLKPENILLCRDGHLKLTDFGLSRYFETRPPAPEDILDTPNNAQSDKKDYVTRSFCGTEQYMSPEMLLQQGHNYRMDWWCLGLLMHEMITGKHPFHGATHYDTLRNMVTKPPNLDPRLTQGAAGLIRALLVKNPRARLGGKEGLSEFQHVSYLAPPSVPVTWQQLYDLQIDMPYKPKLGDEADVSSFETTFTKEKPIDSTIDASQQHLDGDEGGEGGAGGAGKKKKQGGVFSALFGGSKKKTKNSNNKNNAANNNNHKNAKDSDDAFKDFSFAKPDDVEQLQQQQQQQQQQTNVLDL